MKQTQQTQLFWMLICFFEFAWFDISEAIMCGNIVDMRSCPCPYRTDIGPYAIAIASQGSISINSTVIQGHGYLSLSGTRWSQLNSVAQFVDPDTGQLSPYSSRNYSTAGSHWPSLTVAYEGAPASGAKDQYGYSCLNPLRQFASVGSSPLIHAVDWWPVSSYQMPFTDEELCFYKGYISTVDADALSTVDGSSALDATTLSNINAFGVDQIIRDIFTITGEGILTSDWDYEMTYSPLISTSTCRQNAWSGTSRGARLSRNAVVEIAYSLTHQTVLTTVGVGPYSRPTPLVMCMNDWTGPNCDIPRHTATNPNTGVTYCSNGPMPPSIECVTPGSNAAGVTNAFVNLPLEFPVHSCSAAWTGSQDGVQQSLTGAQYSNGNPSYPIAKMIPDSSWGPGGCANYDFRGTVEMLDASFGTITNYCDTLILNTQPIDSVTYFNTKMNFDTRHEMFVDAGYSGAFTGVWNFGGGMPCAIAGCICSSRFTTMPDYGASGETYIPNTWPTLCEVDTNPYCGFQNTSFLFSSTTSFGPAGAMDQYFTSSRDLTGNNISAPSVVWPPLTSTTTVSVQLALLNTVNVKVGIPSTDVMRSSPNASPETTYLDSLCTFVSTSLVAPQIPSIYVNTDLYSTLQKFRIPASCPYNIQTTVIHSILTLVSTSLRYTFKLNSVSSAVSALDALKCPVYQDSGQCASGLGTCSKNWLNSSRTGCINCPYPLHGRDCSLTCECPSASVPCNGCPVHSTCNKTLGSGEGWYVNPNPVSLACDCNSGYVNVAYGSLTASSCFTCQDEKGNDVPNCSGHGYCPTVYSGSPSGLQCVCNQGQVGRVCQFPTHVSLSCGNSAIPVACNYTGLGPNSLYDYRYTCLISTQLHTNTVPDEVWSLQASCNSINLVSQNAPTSSPTLLNNTNACNALKTQCDSQVQISNPQQVQNICPIPFYYFPQVSPAYNVPFCDAPVAAQYHTATMYGTLVHCWMVDYQTQMFQCVSSPSTSNLLVNCEINFGISAYNFGSDDFARALVSSCT